MARLFGIHMIGLRAGVTPEDFETFIVEEVYPTMQVTRPTKLFAQR